MTEHLKLDATHVRRLLDRLSALEASVTDHIGAVTLHLAALTEVAKTVHDTRSALDRALETNTEIRPFEYGPEIG